MTGYCDPPPIPRVGAPKGNQNAKKAKIWEQAIKRALARHSDSNIDSGLDQLADKLVQEALNGESWAMQEIGNRMDGKPVQALVGGDEDDPPIRISAILIRAVDP